MSLWFRSLKLKFTKSTIQFHFRNYLSKNLKNNRLDSRIDVGPTFIDFGILFQALLPYYLERGNVLFCAVLIQGPMFIL